MNITLPRATVEQALEILEKLVVGSDYEEAVEAEQAMESFRAALAQQAEPVQESSAYSKDWCLRMAQIEMDAGAEFEIGPDRAQQAEPVEPVAWAFRHSDGTYHDPSVTEHSAGMVPLYPPPPQRKPLTEEEIDAVWDQWFGAYGLRGPRGPYTRRGFARAVERALEEKNRGR